MAKENSTKKEITIDGLARIVQGGFLNVEGRLDKIETNIKEIKSDIKEMKSDIGEVKLDTEDIKADLNKKVDKIDHNTLEYRVEKLEKKFA